MFQLDINSTMHFKFCTVMSIRFLEFQVSLLEYNAKHAQFKILPRYKVKSEGEFVSIQWMLELLYLNTSDGGRVRFFRKN